MIDVLLPFYGDPSLMRLAVHSVLEQETAGWRLVVVDDNYPDRAATDWLLALDRADVRYVRNQRTLGVNGNFRHALSLATAEHVVFLGCDDLLGPGYIGAMRRAIAQHPRAAVVSPGVEVIDGEGRTSEPLVDRVRRSGVVVGVQDVGCSGTGAGRLGGLRSRIHIPMVCEKRPPGYPPVRPSGPDCSPGVTSPFS